jgi:hypothetical protein
MQVSDRYDEVFEIEIDGWCYGLTNFPGEVSSGLVHRVVNELTDVFLAAIEHNYVFNILSVAERVSKAAKYLIDEREITFSILAQLPNPTTLNEDQKFVLAQIVDQAEQAYGGALERLEKKWSWEMKKVQPPPKRAA